MQLLFISQFFPDPRGTGAQRRAWIHLTALTAAGDVDALILTPPLAEEAVRGALSPTHDITRNALALTVESPYTAQVRSDSGVSLIWHALAHNNMRRRRIDRPSMAAIEVAGLRSHYDAAFCFRIASYSAWQQLAREVGMSADRVVVDFDDIESGALYRAWRHEKARLGRVKGLQELIDVLNIRRIESRILRAPVDVLICSETDRKKLAKRASLVSRIHVLPNTIDLADKALLPAERSGFRDELLFLGAMNYPPNVDGAGFLVNEILPLIRAGRDRPARVSIVGFNPTPQVKALGSRDDVEVTGGVDDVLPYYRRAAIALVPLRFGGGTRIKILEAMAYGRPVVSTHLGAEGLDVTDGKDILLADGPAEFASKVQHLLDDEDLRWTLVANARQLLETRYSHEVALAQIGAIVGGVAQ